MRSQRLYETRERIIKALQRLAEELCARVYLFGSYARGDHTLESDVDIIIVSDRFRGIPVQERVVMVRLRLPFNVGFDIIPLTPEEFEEKKSKALIRDASRYWIPIGSSHSSKCK